MGWFCVWFGFVVFCFFSFGGVVVVLFFKSVYGTASNLTFLGFFLNEACIALNQNLRHEHSHNLNADI